MSDRIGYHWLKSAQNGKIDTVLKCICRFNAGALCLRFVKRSDRAPAMDRVVTTVSTRRIDDIAD